MVPQIIRVSLIAVAHSSGDQTFSRRLVHQLIRIGLVCRGCRTPRCNHQQTTIIKRLNDVGSPEIISLYPGSVVSLFLAQHWRIATILIVIVFTTSERNDEIFTPSQTWCPELYRHPSG